jgi:ankyrin repeat protein
MSYLRLLRPNGCIVYQCNSAAARQGCRKRFISNQPNYAASTNKGTNSACSSSSAKNTPASASSSPRAVPTASVDYAKQLQSQINSLRASSYNSEQYHDDAVPSIYDVSSEDIKYLGLKNEKHHQILDISATQSHKTRQNFESSHHSQQDQASLSFSVASMRVVNLSILDKLDLTLLQPQNSKNSLNQGNSHSISVRNSPPTNKFNLISPYSSSVQPSIITAATLFDPLQRHNLFDSIHDSEVFLINKQLIPELFNLLNNNGENEPSTAPLINSKPQSLLSLAKLARHQPDATELTVQIKDKSVSPQNNLALITQGLANIPSVNLAELMQQQEAKTMKLRHQSGEIPAKPQIKQLDPSQKRLLMAAHNGENHIILEILEGRYNESNPSFPMSKAPKDAYLSYPITSKLDGKPPTSRDSRRETWDLNEIRDFDRHGGTALHEAALGGHIETLELLISKGAEINSLAFNHSTPLHWAAGAGNYDAVQLLLHLGANPALKSITWGINVWGKGSGQTAAHWAAESGHTNIVQLLHLYAPTASFSLDERQQSPVDLAAKQGKWTAKKWLEEAKQEEYVAVKLTVQFKAQKIVHNNHNKPQKRAKQEEVRLEASEETGYSQ